MEILFDTITNYLNTLDWMYILTFILIGYLVNYCKLTILITKWAKIRIRTRYRVAIVGGLYGMILYFIRGYSYREIETLLASFVFALVFHKLLIEVLVNRFFSKTSSTPNTTQKP